MSCERFEDWVYPYPAGKKISSNIAGEPNIPGWVEKLIFQLCFNVLAVCRCTENKTTKNQHKFYNIKFYHNFFIRYI